MNGKYTRSPPEDEKSILHKPADGPCSLDATSSFIHSFISLHSQFKMLQRAHPREEEEQQAVKSRIEAVLALAVSRLVFCLSNSRSPSLIFLPDPEPVGIQAP